MSGDALSNNEIKSRSLSGAKWLILTNGFGIPASYLITLILGWSSQSALGAFSLAQVFIAVITTFAVFGGPSVLANFMPKLPDAESRGRFLFTYLILLSVMTTVVLVVFYIFPEITEFLLRRPLDNQSFPWFVLLTFVVVFAECLTGTCDGLLRIKLAAVARLMARIVILPVVAILYLSDADILQTHTLEVLLGGFLVAYIVSALSCSTGILRDPRFGISAGWFLPPGFTEFALTSSAAVVFAFFYNNFDRICVLYYGDIDGLGKYQAVLSLALLIDYIPNMLQRALVPTFSSLIASNSRNAYHRSFHFVYRNAVILMTSLALVMTAFSYELLAVFGTAYTVYYVLLGLFCLTNIVRSHAFATMAVLTSMEKNALRLWIGFIQIALQVVITFVFIDRYGVMAIAGAKLAAVVVASSLGHGYVIYRLHMAPGIPRCFKAAILSGLLAFCLRVWMIPFGWLPSALIAAGTLLLFLVTARVSPAEVKSLLSQFQNRRLAAAPDRGPKG